MIGNVGIEWLDKETVRVLLFDETGEIMGAIDTLYFEGIEYWRMPEKGEKR